MTDKEVQDIFAEELAGKPTEEALMAAQNRIAVHILAGLAGVSVSDTGWGLLKNTAHAKSRLGRFIGIAPNSILTVLSNEALKEVIFLYTRWLDVVDYFYNHFEEMDSEEFKKFWPSKEEILETKNTLAEKCEKINLQFAITETILLNHGDFRWMEQTFNWAFLAVLGREHFDQFQEEFNKTAALLRKYQTELLAPSA